MNKPNDYENTQASGDYTPVRLGGHKLVIKQVSEKMSSTNKPMIVVLFDFDKGDDQADYFMESFKNDIRPDKKWPNQATKYILTEEAQSDKCSKSFKTFCTCVEKSNPGFSCWKSDNTFNFDGIKNKKVGCNFGEELDWYNGKEVKKRILRWFCSIDKVAEQTIPEVTETEAHKQASSNAAIVSEAGGDFMAIPDGIPEELPFN